jgi:hypothetical protein
MEIQQKRFLKGDKIMKPKKYTFYFRGGRITVNAHNQEQAKILAQARAIERGWDHTIQPEMNTAEARRYLQNVVGTWDEFCRSHRRLALAIKIITEEEH